MGTMLIVMAVLLCIPVLVGAYVYRDATRRGMNALLWALIAAFVPSMIGLIIYLLVRGQYADLECPRCRTMVGEQFMVCPSCGTKLRPACPNCGTAVELNWRVCPQCATPLPETQTDVQVPVRAKDRGLWKVLAVILIIPTLLIVMLLAVSSSAFNGGASSFYEVSAESYFTEQSQKSEFTSESVQRWLDGLEPASHHAYALSYEESSGEENQYFYLIYVPATGEQTHTGLGSSSSIFGRTLTLELEQTGRDGVFFCVSTSGKKMPSLNIKLDGKRIPCDVTAVEYNPVL